MRTPSPLLLSWSDARCSSRFYDYGSSQMAKALASDPSKASKWRTAEVEAAVPFEELVLAAEHPAMEEEDAGPQPEMVVS